MARNYSIVGNATNTASATLPLVTVISTAAVRPRIYYMNMGSDATPADNAGKYVVQRCTTTGTAGSSVTPELLDRAGDPAAVVTSGLAVFTVAPTFTASQFLFQWAQNMRATFQWYAVPTKELVLSAVASSGCGILPTVTTTAVNMVFTIHYEE